MAAAMAALHPGRLHVPLVGDRGGRRPAEVGARGPHREPVPGVRQGIPELVRGPHALLGRQPAGDLGENRSPREEAEAGRSNPTNSAACSPQPDRGPTSTSWPPAPASVATSLANWLGVTST